MAFEIAFLHIWLEVGVGAVGSTISFKTGLKDDTTALTFYDFQGPSQYKVVVLSVQESQYKDKTVSRPYYLYTENTITGKTAFILKRGPGIGQSFGEAMHSTMKHVIINMAMHDQFLHSLMSAGRGCCRSMNVSLYAIRGWNNLWVIWVGFGGLTVLYN